MSPFEAKWHGECAACGEHITEGDLIDYNDDGWIVHADCPDESDASAPAQNERKCPNCFLIHAGECM